MSNTVKVLITIDPCCDRVKYLSDILQQARSLNLNEDYTVAIENLILQIMPVASAQDELGVVSLYDSNIDNLLALRDSSFNEWKDDVKSRHVPIPKSQQA